MTGKQKIKKYGKSPEHTRLYHVALVYDMVVVAEDEASAEEVARVCLLYSKGRENPSDATTVSEIESEEDIPESWSADETPWSELAHNLCGSSIEDLLAEQAAGKSLT